MPVNLDFANSIISAYAQGRQEALQREQLKKQQEQQKIENEQKEAQFKEQQHQFKEEQKRISDQFKANQEMQKADFNLRQTMALPAFLELAEKTGNIPGARKEDFITEQGEIDPTRSSFVLPEALGGFNISAAIPNVAARREAERQRILMEPEVQAKRLIQGDELTAKAIIEGTKLNEESVQNMLDRESRERIAETRRRATIEAARLRGVNDRTINQAMSLEKDFSGRPIVKTFNNTKLGVDYANSYDFKTSTGADDLGLIIAHAKVSDPDTGVKEGEVERVRTYAQNLADSLDFKLGRISGSSKFLSEAASNAIKKDLQRRYNASKKAYDNFKNEAAKKFKNIGQDIDDWVPDYTKGYESLSGAGNKVIPFEELK